MKDSKLMEVLSEFSKSQLNSFILFVQSPFFNKRQEVLRLLEYIANYFPNYSIETFSRNNAFRHIHPEKPFNEKTIGYYQSFLLKLAEEFLVYEELEERKVLKSSLLLCKLNQMDLAKPMNSELKKTAKVMEQYPYRNGIYFLDTYLVKRQENDFFYKNQYREFDDSIQSAMIDLDSFYLAEKLRYGCAMINRQRMVGKQFDQRFLKEILRDIQQEQHKEKPVVLIYGTILQGLIEPNNDKHFFVLRELLIKHINDFTPVEIKDQYIYAMNFCIRRINAGEIEYYKQIFELFKILLKQGVLIENDKISHIEFLNIVSTAIQLEEYAWVENFIQEYRNNLVPSLKTTVVNYNLALLYFAQNDLDKAHRTLNKVEFQDVFYTLKSKMLLLKIYYEQRDFDVLHSYIESFRHYLRRTNQLVAARKKPFSNTISLILKLAKINQALQPKKLQQFEQKFKETINTEKKWLRQKIDELKKM